MVRGKLYEFKDAKIVVMCTKSDASNYFEGVVLSSKIQQDIIGLHSTLFHVNKYTEYVGQLDLNNIFIK